MSSLAGYSCLPLVTSAALALASTVVSAVEVRPASEDEITSALQGCWNQEASFRLKQFERAGFFNEHTVCFGPEDRAHASWVGGDAIGIEAGGDAGTFQLEAGKLVLTNLGNYLGRDQVSCDVIMRSDHAVVRFENCLGSGPYPSGAPQDPTVIPNMSFSKVAE